MNWSEESNLRLGGKMYLRPGVDEAKHGISSWSVGDLEVFSSYQLLLLTTLAQNDTYIIAWTYIQP